MTTDARTDHARIVAAVCQARALPAAQLGAVVAALRDNGAGMLASCIIGELPFTPSAAELERLTDE